MSKIKESDLLYKDKEYRIYKKDAGALGVFMPLSCFDLIHIAINGLSQWENGGFAREDYQEIIDKVCQDLQKTVKKNLPFEADKNETGQQKPIGVERTPNQLIKELRRLSKKKGVIPVSDNKDERIRQNN